MLNKSNVRFNFLLTFLVLGTLFLSDKIIDPVSLPKFTILWLGIGFLLIPSIVQLITLNRSKSLRILSLLLVVLTTALVIAFLSDNPYQAIYGTFQRNNGVLFIILILGVFVVSTSSYSSRNFSVLNNLLITLGLVESFLGIAQYLGFELIVARNEYSPILGTFGNPNHYSSFIGFTLICACYVVLYLRSSLIVFILSLVLLVTGLSTILLSQSIQGIFVFATGFVVLVAVNFWEKKMLRNVFLFMVALFGTFSLLGLINIGPLKRILFQDSNLYRWDYWRAAIQAIKNQPLIGYGPDQFASAYALLRDDAAIQRRSTIISDNAHNWFLQIGSTYGLLFLILFLSLVLLILKKSIDNCKNSQTRQHGSLFLALWLGYLAQSFIGVENSTISGWGWLFAGSIMSLSLSFSGVDESSRKRDKKHTKSSRASQRLPIYVTSFISLLAFGLILSPSIRATSLLTTVDRKFYQPGTVYPGEDIARKLEATTPIGSGDVKIWLFLARIRYGAGDAQGSELLLKKALKYFPKEGETYNYLSQLEENRGNTQAALEYCKALFNVNPRNVSNLERMMALSKTLKDYPMYVVAKNAYVKIMNNDSLKPELIW